MVKKRIFILGISGFIGYNLAYHLRHKYSVTGVYFNHPISIPDVHSYPLNMDSFKLLIDRYMKMLRPSYTIMASGLNNLKECEENKSLASIVNTYIPLALAQSASDREIPNIHLSCAEILDGKKKQSKEENQNFHSHELAQSKATGEGYIRTQSISSTILRFGRVLGISHFHQPSFLDTVRKNLTQDKSLPVNPNTTHSYISLYNLIYAIERLLENKPANLSPIYHLGGVEENEKNICTLLGQCLQFPKPLKLLLEEDSATQNYTLSSKKFSNQFNWKPETKEEFSANIKKQSNQISDHI